MKKSVQILVGSFAVSFGCAVSSEAIRPLADVSPVPDAGAAPLDAGLSEEAGPDATPPPAPAVVAHDGKCEATKPGSKTTFATVPVPGKGIDELARTVAYACVDPMEALGAPPGFGCVQVPVYVLAGFVGAICGDPSILPKSTPVSVRFLVP